MSEESKDSNPDLRIVGPVFGNENEIHQPRQPQNMQDLLRYSVEAGSLVNSVSNLQSMQPLDSQRRHFLEEALSTMTRDVVAELKEAITTLSPLRNQGTRNDEDEVPLYEDAFTQISELVENIDIANDFQKLNGFKLMGDCILANFSSVRWNAANVIALCAQNNPVCQKSAANEGLIQKLMCMMDQDPDEKCRVKALYALSCIIRDFEEGLMVFIQQDGFSLLVRALQTQNDTLRTKSAFLVSSLTYKNPQIKDTLNKMGFVEQLVGLIQGDHTRAHEHLLSALLLIIVDNEPAILECQRPELQLRSTLLSIIEEFKNDEAYMEEVEFAKQILSTVFNRDTEGER